LKEKDYYTLLGVSKNSDKKEIKKKYRKLTMKFHPDRNKDPGAEEAFKKISRACDCLTDVEKRRLYDQYGTETPEMRQHFRRQYQHMTPEDLFNIFAGGSFMGGQRGRGSTFSFGGRGQRQDARPPAQGWQAIGQVLVQALPILLLFVFSFLGSSSTDNSLFSLTRTGRFTVQKKTPLDTSFYVDQSFHYHYENRRSAMRVIHDQVEGQYVTQLQEECNSQKSAKEKLKRTASGLTGNERVNLLRRVQGMDQSSCEKLKTYVDDA